MNKFIMIMPKCRIFFPNSSQGPFPNIAEKGHALNICMEEFIIFVCSDSTEIFSKLRSAGLNYNLPSFFH